MDGDDMIDIDDIEQTGNHPDEQGKVNLAEDLTAKLQWLRRILAEMKDHLALFIRHPYFEEADVKLPLNCVPGSVHTNMRSNMGLVYRHLEDAVIRTGMALQTMKGGVVPPLKIAEEQAGAETPQEAADTPD